jgi:hypothetical protein
MQQNNNVPMFFCTAADSEHYPQLINLIGSIHKHNFDDLVEIAIFDLGLHPEHKQELSRIYKTNVYEVEKANPLIVTKLHSNDSRWIKGLFSWKAVIIKQALKMFPYVVYADAGTTIMNPVNNLFKHIEQNGYFISDCGHSIKSMTTNFIIKQLHLETPDNKWLLDENTLGIDAGFIGVSRSQLDSFIEPLYKLSADIQNFIDDGTCPGGWGRGRHDQTLFSIHTQQLKLKILKHDRPTEKCFLTVDGKQVLFHLTHTPTTLNSDTVVFRSRKLISPEFLNHHISHTKIRPKS